MTQWSANQAEMSAWRRTALRVVTVLATLLLAAVAVGIAAYMGQQIEREEWRILITATGVATYIVIAVINAKHAFLLWLLTAPFARFVYLNIELGRGIPDMSLNRVMTGVLLVLLLASVAGQRRRLVRLVWADALLLLFAAASMFSVPSSLTPLKSAMQSFFDLVLVPIAVYFLARNLIVTREDLEQLIIVLFVIGTYLGFLATREQLTGVVWFYPENRSLIYSGSIRRVVGLMGNPACMGLSLAALVPWGWYVWLNARRGRPLLLALVALMMAGCYFCMNRSGWIGLAAGLLIMGLFLKRFRRTFVILLLIAVIVAAVYWAVIVTSTVVQSRLKAQGPIEYRVDTWAVAGRMLRDNLLFGVGYENFGTMFKRYGYWDANAPVVPYPHNTYLWVLLMGGLAALLPFIGFLVATTWSALRTATRRVVKLDLSLELAQPGLATSNTEIAGVFLASTAAIFGPALVGDIFYCYYMMMIIFSIMGAMMAVITNRLAEEPQVLDWGPEAVGLPSDPDWQRGDQL